VLAARAAGARRVIVMEASVGARASRGARQPPQASADPPRFDHGTGLLTDRYGRRVQSAILAFVTG